MAKDFKKLLQKEKMVSKSPKSKTVKRFWGNATRLEFPNVRGKSK